MATLARGGLMLPQLWHSDAWSRSHPPHLLWVRTGHSTRSAQCPLRANSGHSPALEGLSGDALLALSFAEIGALAVNLDQMSTIDVEAEGPVIS
jgi:hypothetical protein